MVSPPITPSSFPPVLHTPASVKGESPVTETHRQAAYAAFDHWSQIDRNEPLDALKDEHRPISRMLEVVAQCPPIVRGGEQVARHLLVPQVVLWLEKNRKPFKGIRYATQVVENALDEWGRKGVPGADRSSSTSRPAAPALTGSLVFDPEAPR